MRLLKLFATLTTLISLIALIGCARGSVCGGAFNNNNIPASNCNLGTNNGGGGGGGNTSPVEFVYAADIGSSGQFIAGFELDANNMFAPITNFVAPALPGSSVSTTFTVAAGKFLYGVPGDGTVRGFSIGSGGALSEVSGSPFTVPGAVSIGSNPAGTLLVAASTDLLHVFTIGSGGAITEVSGSPFVNSVSGAELAFANNGAFLYTTDNASSNISGFSVNSSTGALTPLSGSPFTIGVNFIATAPAVNGGFLVGATGINQLATFAIDPTTGALTQVSTSPMTTTANTFQDFMDPTGHFVYVSEQNSGAITNMEGFQLNTSTGALTAIPGSPFTSIGSPDNFGFSVNSKGTLMVLDIGGGLNIFAINTTTGALTQVGATQGTFTAFPVITP